MKEALYITPVFPQQRVVKTIDTLIKNNIQVTILTYNIDHQKQYILDNSHKGLKVISLNLKGKSKLLPFKSLLFHNKIKEILKKSFDVIIFRDIFTFDLAKTLCKKSNNRLIMDLADNYPEVMQSKFKNKKLGQFISHSLNIIERKAIKYSYKVLTVTENSKELLSLKHSVNQNKFFILKNYPDRIIEDKNDDLSLEKVSAASTIKLVYVGTVDESVRDLGTVFSYLKNSEFALDIYTSNKDLVIKLIEKYDVSQNVNILNPVNRHVLPKILMNYDIGIIPHKLVPGTKYTIPNKLYDYIHSNLMVLSTENSAMKTEINNLGIGDTYSTKEDFFNKISHLVNNKNLYIKNLKIAKEKCKWEKQENIILEMFKN